MFLGLEYIFKWDGTLIQDEKEEKKEEQKDNNDKSNNEIEMVPFAEAFMDIEFMDINGDVTDSRYEGNLITENDYIKDGG